MLFLEFFHEAVNLWKNDQKSEARWMFLIAFLALLLLVGSPLITIGSINYLCRTNIPLDFFSWCAVYWLIFVVRTMLVPFRRSHLSNSQQYVWAVGSSQIPTALENNDEEE